MKAKYYKEDDLLVLRLSSKQYEVAEKLGSFIVHYDIKKNPVLIEVLNASRFLKETSRALPKAIRQSLFSPA